MKKMNRIAALICAAALLLTAAVFVIMPSIAKTDAYRSTRATQTPIRAERLTQSSAQDYRYFVAPTTISPMTDNRIMVTDGSFAESFLLSDKSHARLDYSIDSGTDKALFSADGNSLITLSSGTLTWHFNESGTIKTVAVAGTDYTDITMRKDGTLFAAQAKQVWALTQNDATATALFSLSDLTGSVSNPDSKNIRKIAATDSGIYLVYSSLNNALLDDIAFVALDNGVYSTYTLSIDAVERILDLEVLPSGKGVLARFNAGLHRYNKKGTQLILSQTIAASDLTAMCVSGATAYALTVQKSVVQFDLSSGARTVFLASAHNEIGFFDAPLGIASRKGNVYIADERNNRVQIITPDKTQEITGLTRPKAVAVDYYGRIFVAHAVNEIAVFSPELTLQKSMKAPDESVLITQLVFDSKNNLYVLSGNAQLYKIAADTQSFESICQDQAVSALTVAPQTDTLYMMSRKLDQNAQPTQNTDTLKMLLADEAVTECTFSADSTKTATDFTVCDFLIDHDGSAFMLTDSGDIVKFTTTNDGAFRLQIDAPTPYASDAKVSSDAKRITLSTAAHSQLNCDDLLISDTGRHAVKVIAGADLKVNEFFKNEQLPDVSDEPQPIKQNQIVHTLLFDSEVYAQKAESEILIRLKAGTRILLPDQINANETFTHVLCDNLANGDAMIGGYVYTAMIHLTPLAYAAPSNGFCYTWIQSVPIYQYPSKNAPKVSGYTALPQNAQLKLLDFVYTDNLYGYTDNFANATVFYRVAFGAELQFEGYVVASNTSPYSVQTQTLQYPRYNAVVSAANGAALFARNDDGTYTQLDEPFLSNDTKVEIIGAFDSSQPYTEIKVLIRDGDNEHVIQRWVKTADLRYTGINKVQVVAVAVILVTVVLIGFIVGRIVYLRRNPKVLREAKKTDKNRFIR